MGQVPVPTGFLSAAELATISDEELQFLVEAGEDPFIVQAQGEIDRRAAASEVAVSEVPPAFVEQPLETELALDIKGMEQRAREAATVSIEAMRAGIELAVAQAVEGAAIARAALAESVAADLQRVREELNSTIYNVATLLATQQSSLQASDQVAEELNEASGEGGLLGFVGRVAGFIASPADAFLDKIGAYILREVRDGLNK